MGNVFFFLIRWTLVTVNYTPLRVNSVILINIVDWCKVILCYFDHCVWFWWGKRNTTWYFLYDCGFISSNYHPAPRREWMEFETPANRYGVACCCPGGPRAVQRNVTCLLASLRGYFTTFPFSWSKTTIRMLLFFCVCHDTYAIFFFNHVSLLFIFRIKCFVHQKGYCVCFGQYLVL